MKVNWKFLSTLHKFLISDDWTVALKSRIEEIDKELKITPPQNLINLMKNARPRNENDKNWKVKNVFNEETKNKIIKSQEKKLEKLKQEKIKIETCLNNNSYMLGIAPFDDINNTKLLLANIHLLDLKTPGMLFNEKAVMAVKNMFKENFHKLYDLKVSNIACNNVGHLPESKITLFMTKIIENKELKLEDIFEAFGPTENQVEQAVIHEDLQPGIIINQDILLNPPVILNQNIILNQQINLDPRFAINFNQDFTLNPPIILNNELTQNEEIAPNEEVILNNNEPIINQEGNFQERLNSFKEMAPKLLSLYKALDPKILEYSYNLMQFISQFYMNDHGPDGGFSMLATQLAFCFDKTEDIDNFLEKEVNFESFQTIENTIALIGSEFFEASEVSLPEIKIWRKINGKHGKEAIKLFAKAGDLKSAGFDICEFAQTNEIEDVYKKAHELSKALKYKDEESHKELAKLMHEYNYSEKIFNKVVKEVLPKQKKEDLIPNISFKMKLLKKGEFTFSKLKPGALEGLFLGKKSYSCQSIEGDGEKCAIDGFARKDAGFYVFRNKKGEIIAQSYAWIGQNKNGEDVLVLDSYEYVPVSAHKDLFVMAMKELEVKIKKFGFSELYVGCGGRTPKLSSKQLHDAVKPKDKGLFQYYDSKSVYKITKDICLKEDNDSDILIEYKDFTEFCDQNLVLNWDKIIAENHDSEKSLLDTHDTVIFNLNNSKLLKYLIQKQIIPFEMIATMAKTCFTILPDTHHLSLKTRIELIEEILIVANKNIGAAFKLINICSQIHPILAQEMNIKKLIEFCGKFKYDLPIIIKNTQLDGLSEESQESLLKSNGIDKETQEIGLKIVALCIQKFGIESEKFVKLLNNLPSINSELIKTCSIEILLEVCTGFEYIPSCLCSYSTLEIDSVLEIFPLVMKKYVGDYKTISNILNKISSINPQLIKIIDFEKLIELGSKLEYIPSVIGSLNSEVQLKLALCAFETNKNDIQKIIETCNNLESVNPALLDLLEPKILIEFCGNVGFMPFGMRNSNKNIINEKSKDFISCTFNKYQDNFTIINKVVDSLFQLNQEVFNEVDNVKLVEVLAKSDYMPSVLSKYTSIDSIKRLELVKELFKFSPDIIIEICDTKLDYNLDTQEVNQIQVYAEGFEKNMIGELIFEEHNNN